MRPAVLFYIEGLRLFWVLSRDLCSGFILNMPSLYVRLGPSLGVHCSSRFSDASLAQGFLGLKAEWFRVIIVLGFLGVELLGFRLADRRQDFTVKSRWVVVNIRVPFWVLIIIRQLVAIVCRVPKTGS